MRFPRFHISVRFLAALLLRMRLTKLLAHFLPPPSPPSHIAQDDPHLWRLRNLSEDYILQVQVGDALRAKLPRIGLRAVASCPAAAARAHRMRRQFCPLLAAAVAVAASPLLPSPRRPPRPPRQTVRWNRRGAGDGGWRDDFCALLRRVAYTWFC